MNRARECVKRALWYIGNGGQWQTIAELLSMALGEIAELEQAVTVSPDPPTIRVLPGEGLVRAGLSEGRKTLTYQENALTGPYRGIAEASARGKRL